MPTLSLSAIGLFAVLLGFDNFIANRSRTDCRCGEPHIRSPGSGSLLRLEAELRSRGAVCGHGHTRLLLTELFLDRDQRVGTRRQAMDGKVAILAGDREEGVRRDIE